MYTKLFLSSLCLVVIISNLPSCLQASKYENDSYWVEHADEFDDYWKQRAKEAEKFNKEAYCPNPYELTGNFTTTVKESIAGNKSVRRNLKGKIFGPCMATNPIDSCWRCDPNWHKHRERLADCVKGFGRKTTGGKGGKVYIVTDPSDDELVWPKVGTLRHAVTRKEPLWIIFSRSMTIRLQQELIVASDKTIDGRGVDVYIANGAGFMLQFVRNVIIHGIKIYNIKAGQGGTIRSTETNYGTRTPSDGDGISIFGSSNIWIDHVSMKNCADGLIDAIMGSTAITISNCHFTDHNDVMLFGASDAHTADVIMQITLAFNHFGKRLIQRMPRVRYGFVHVVNNDYTHWEMYAIGGSMHPTIISEGNRYIAPDITNPNINAKEITKRVVPDGYDWRSWQWRSINDEKLNGAFFVESGSDIKNIPSSIKNYMISAKPGSYVGLLTRYAGILRCRVGSPC